jgi:hypothetical protein
MRQLSRFLLIATAAVLTEVASDPVRSRPPRVPPNLLTQRGRGYHNPAGTFFLGRLKYGKNHGRDCGMVGVDLIKLLSRVSTLTVREERILGPTNPAIFETPLLFMNGHHDFVLSSADIESLRVYFQHGGFLLASECCTKPPFPKAWRREFSRIFPGEEIRVLPYDHPIYRSFYTLKDIPCLHEDRHVYLEGLFYEGRLVAVLCGDGLCCAFTMDNRCNKGRGVSPDDGKKLALNIAVYALTH